MTIPILIISMLLFFVLFFGIGFILNMLLRMTWIMGIIYPIIAILIIDNVRFVEYFSKTSEAFQKLGVKLASLHPSDILILLFGFFGALASGFVMRILRSKGYRMF
jgi:uncharacterized SAM-binding protein YcdF (DUF218 family)